MNKILTAISAALLAGGAAQAEVTIPVFDHVTFYDGYLVKSIPETAPDEGCLRLYTFLNSKKITDEQLDQLGEHLSMQVRVHPLCDNYDRIGSVNLAIVPKGDESYTADYNDSDPMRIEMARFITPFMDKNKDVQSVPYDYSIDYVSNILRDKQLRENYDFWLELMIFGVPYAANSQIAGCAGCNDVFQGSVDFYTDDEPAPLVDSNVFVPIVIRTPDYRADRGINNYNEACTDQLGKTMKTYTFEVPEDCADARVMLIMSNHGAGTKGEEYSRRQHYVYFDDEQALTFKPGRTSCEPFRQYNTQANGIYGTAAKTDASWQSFSNWCPGDVIDTRPIELGPVKAGTHSIRIEVPDARFFGKDGYFPVSLYFQGDTKGKLPSTDIISIEADDYTTSLSLEGTRLTVSAPAAIESVGVYSLGGQMMFKAGGCGRNEITLSTRGLDKGVYVVTVSTADGRNEAHKIAL